MKIIAHTILTSLLVATFTHSPSVVVAAASFQVLQPIFFFFLAPVRRTVHNDDGPDGL